MQKLLSYLQKYILYICMSFVISLNSNTCKFINKYYALLHKTSIKIHLSQNTPCTIGAMYRHSHQNITLFQKKMKHALHNLNKSKGIYYIVGDFNINLLNSNNNTVIKSYSNMVYSQGMFAYNHPTDKNYRKQFYFN